VTLLALSLLACSDHKLINSEELGYQPDLLVDPEEIIVSGCGVSEQVVTIANIGEATLEISDILIEGSGWTIEEGGDTDILVVGESQQIVLTAADGTANLRIDSDDPDSPQTRVFLDGDLDDAPELTITSPSPGEVLPVGTPFTLSALVEDDFDAPTDLSLAWTSSVDGLIGAAAADPSGLSEVAWAFDGRTSGDQTLTVTTTDSCGNTGEASVSICQQGGYSSDQLSISSWHFEGATSWDDENDWLELTPVVEWQVGSAFATDEIVSGAEVEIAFNFYIGDGTGADGFSLTALDTERMTSFLGGDGCGMGYGGNATCSQDGQLPGWSIEIDTWYNAGQDPTEEDHVMFTFDGDLTNYATWAVIPEMEDTGWHLMEVVVQAPFVTISIDGVALIDEELEGYFDFPAYVGFTASTGGSTNHHLIDSLAVTDYACDPG
jgi:hypothetical protein